jgi:RimJ/RimL family protein N-acetyltransferase
MSENSHAFPADTVLRGEGFVLRPLHDDDVNDVLLAASDKLTQRWLPLPSPYTLDTARAFVSEFAPAMLESGLGIVRAIDVDDRLAGCIDLKHTDWRARTTEVGYWVAPWGRGNGLAGRATRVLAEWALLETGLERVELRAATGNVASQRAAETAGFAREGVLRNAGFTHEGRVDLAVYSLIRADLAL